MNERVAVPTTRAPAMAMVEPTRVLRRCPHCAASLLATDFLHRPAKIMTHALAWHHDGACKNRRDAISAATGVLSELLDELDHGEDLDDDIIQRAPWPEAEPPLTFCARHGLHALASRLLAISRGGDCFGSPLDLGPVIAFMLGNC